MVIYWHIAALTLFYFDHLSNWTYRISQFKSKVAIRFLQWPPIFFECNSFFMLSSVAFTSQMRKHANSVMWQCLSNKHVHYTLLQLHL